MTSKEQSLKFLRNHIKVNAVFPTIARYSERQTIDCLQNLGGIAGTWRTDYSECTYSQPQRVNGALVDLSTVELVRAFYDRSGVLA